MAMQARITNVVGNRSQNAEPVGVLASTSRLGEAIVSKDLPTRLRPHSAARRILTISGGFFVIMFGSAGLTYLAGAIVSWSVLGGSAVLLARDMLRRGYSFNARSSAADLAGRMGDSATASDLLEALALEHRGQPGLFANAMHNLGVTELYAGRTRRALAGLLLAHKNGAYFKNRAQADYECSPFYISLAYAFLGHVDDSAGWHKLGVARRTMPHIKVALVAEATCLARRGSFKEAAELVRDNWRNLEATLVARELRIARVIYGFAVANLESADGFNQDLVQGLRPCLLEDLDFMGSDWPELQSYIGGLDFD